MPRGANPLKVLAKQSPEFADVATRVGNLVTSYVNEGKTDQDKAARLITIQALLPIATDAVIVATKGS